MIAPWQSDDDVEPAELRDGVLEAALEVGPVAEVALQREGVEAVGPQRLRLALGARRDAVQADARARLGQTARQAAADAAARARHERAAPRQVERRAHATGLGAKMSS